MDFQLTDEQRMLADAAGAFAKKTSPVSRLRQMREDERGWDPKIWKQMGELGWLGLCAPEAAGGLGMSFFDASLVIEKLGTSLVPEPFVPSVVLAGTALAHAGDAAQQARLLGPMCEGDSSLALAWAESQGRYDVADVQTKATRNAQGWSLSGEKVFVENGHAADHLIVSAQTPEGLALFAVAKGSEGVHLRSFHRMDGGRAAQVRLDGVQLAEADRLSGGDARAALDAALDAGAAAACAEGLGIARTVLDMTVEYLKTRKQFGVAIGSFQVLQHRAVDMFVQVQLLESTSIFAAVRADDDDVLERQRAVSIAKARLGSGGRFVTSQSIQLHGGIGITDEHDVGLYFKRMQILASLYGDEEFHTRRYSESPSFLSGVA